MSENLEQGAKEAAAELAKAVYQDLAHPAAARIGDALASIVKVALTPVALLDWGYEQSKEWLASRIKDGVTRIPPEKIVAPPLAIAIPVVNHIAMSVDRPGHRDIYAELLLKSMDSRTQSAVHPSYVHIAEQLSPEEARLILLLKEVRGPELLAAPRGYNLPEGMLPPLFNEKSSDYGIDGESAPLDMSLEAFCVSQGFESPDRAELWLDNLLRLRLLAIDVWTESELTPAGHNRYGEYQASICTWTTRQIRFTAFGLEFVEACSTPRINPLP